MVQIGRAQIMRCAGSLQCPDQKMFTAIQDFAGGWTEIGQPFADIGQPHLPRR